MFGFTTILFFLSKLFLYLLTFYCGRTDASDGTDVTDQAVITNVIGHFKLLNTTVDKKN